MVLRVSRRPVTTPSVHQPSLVKSDQRTSNKRWSPPQSHFFLEQAVVGGEVGFRSLRPELLVGTLTAATVVVLANQGSVTELFRISSTWIIADATRAAGYAPLVDRLKRNPGFLEEDPWNEDWVADYGGEQAQVAHTDVFGQHFISSLYSEVQRRIPVQAGTWQRHAGYFVYPRQNREPVSSGSTASSVPSGTEYGGEIMWDKESDIPAYFEKITAACRRPASEVSWYELCWRALEELASEPRCTTRMDSRTNCTGSEPSTTSVNTVLDDHFRNDTLNVVVLGAGPVGLALANALTELEHRGSLWGVAQGSSHTKRPLFRAKVAIFENRVVHSGHKKAYERKWITHMMMKHLDGVVDQRVAKLVSSINFEHDYGPIDVPSNVDIVTFPLNMLETILLLSNRERGVRLIYDDYRQFEEYLTAIPNVVVIDASGHRLKPLQKAPATGPSAPSVWPQEPQGLREFLEDEFRLVSTNEFPLKPVHWRKKNVVYPVLSATGDPYTAQFLKITHVPHSLNDRLDEIAGDFRGASPLCNDENAPQWCGPYFRWPCEYRTDVLRRLQTAQNVSLQVIIVSLTLTQTITLQELISTYGHEKIAQLGAIPPSTYSGDDLGQALSNLLRTLASQQTSRQEARLSLYTYDAYAYATPKTMDAALGGIVPLYRLGDSLLSGDANAGTGLRTHFSMIRDLVSRLKGHRPAYIEG